MHIEMAPTVKMTARSVPLEGFRGLGALSLNYSEVDIVNSFFFAGSFHEKKNKKTTTKQTLKSHKWNQTAFVCT